MNVDIDYSKARDLISGLISDVLSYAAKNKLPTDNIEIFMPPLLVDALELEDTLFVGDHSFPIERDDKLEVQFEDGRYKSDIYISNPDW